MHPYTKSLLKGCRSPSSKGFGYWDEAFIVVICPITLTTTSVLFCNGINQLFSPDLEISMDKYKELTKDGWKSMNIEDLKLTTGIDGIHYDDATSKKRNGLIVLSVTILGGVWWLIRNHFRSTAIRLKELA